MWRKVYTGTALAIGFVMALALSGCGGSGETSSGSGPYGGLSVYLTDAPTDEVSSVNVAITGLKIKQSGSSVERSILDQTKIIDLLTLQNARELLVTASVQAGSYQFIEINLDENQSHVILRSDGSRQPIKIPSEEIKVLGGFTVQEGTQTNLVLDFDADKSLVKLGDGSWLLKPVIIME